MFIINPDFFEFKEIISKNLILFMRLKGYSRRSLSKLVPGIPRPTIDLIITGNIVDPAMYNAYVSEIIKSFNLSDYYFLKIQPIPIFNESEIISKEFNTEVLKNIRTDLFIGLETILEIYSMYID